MQNKSENDRWDAVARQLLVSNYGIEAVLAQLPGENRNYLAKLENGDRFVLKIAMPDASRELASLEFAVIEHALDRGFSCALPQILRNRQGDLETRFTRPDGSTGQARLLKHLGGKAMDDLSDVSHKLLFSVGRIVAEFDRLLEDLDLPAAHRSHPWELTGVEQYRDRIPTVKDTDQSEMLTWAFDLWATEAKPYLQEIPWQIIHGDAHEENILVEDDEIVGLLDFGDCNYNPTVCDLAVCLTYMMMDRDDPFAAGAVVVAGYSEIRSLSDMEMSVLFPLIAGRLALSLSVAASRMKIDPSNKNWYVTWDSAWEMLSKLREFSNETAQVKLAALIARGAGFTADS